MDITLPMPVSEANKLVGDKERVNTIILSNRKGLMAFPDSYEGKPFFSFISFSVDNHIVTGYTIDFAPKSDVDNFDREQELDPALRPVDQLIWFANPENNPILNYKFENYLFETLSDRYGNDYSSFDKDSTVVTSDWILTRIHISGKKWVKDGLEVKLSRVTSLGPGFIKLQINYRLSESYLNKFKDQIQTIRTAEKQVNSKF